MGAVRRISRDEHTRVPRQATRFDRQVRDDDVDRSGAVVPAAIAEAGRGVTRDELRGVRLPGVLQHEYRSMGGAGLHGEPGSRRRMHDAADAARESGFAETSEDFARDPAAVAARAGYAELHAGRRPILTRRHRLVRAPAAESRLLAQTRCGDAQRE